MKDSESLDFMVIETLREVPETRNSDVLLTTEIWKRFYPDFILSEAGDGYVFLEDLLVLPREDLIKRIRCVVQNEHNMYLPTDDRVRLHREKYIPK